jgi:hypothetical protein
MRITPGIAAAALVSMLLIFACACGLCRIATCAMPGRSMSAVNSASPRRNSGSSRRLMRAPMMLDAIV